MRPRLTSIRTADDTFEFHLTSPSDAQALAFDLRAKGLAVDVVAGLSHVTVCFDPYRVDEITNWLNEITDINGPDVTTRPIIELGIRYGGEDGPDLNDVCQRLDISTDAFMTRHTSLTHTVEMIGFTPGFSYISGLSADMAVPRLSNPRARVPAGSVGISAAFTGIYALDGPGGWPLIGRTDALLFDADRPSPFLLTPGQRVKFKAV